jgi:tetratricopeptide (TPR) repeat protein
MSGRGASLVLLSIACAVIAPVACAQEPPARNASTAQEALRIGQYDDAIRMARGDASREPANATPVRIHADALRATGKYAEAEDILTAFTRAHPNDAALWNRLGEVQKERGRLAEAAESFQKAISGRAADSLMAQVNLAVLQFDRGEVDQAMTAFDRFIDIYNDRRARLTPTELEAVAIACQYLGRNNPQLIKDAMRAFDEAIAADSTDLDRRVRQGEMFVERFAGDLALTALQGVLATNPRHARANLAMAHLRMFDDLESPSPYVQKALDVNPSLPDARALSALLLIDLERFSEAAAEARKGLTADSTAPAALTALAAAQYLQHDSAAFRATLATIHARQPRSADADVELANVAARSRLYAEAVKFAEAGVTRDPKNARALALLGINAMRTGEMARGRAALDSSFKLDPYDPWSFNTLKLLDTFKDYVEVKTPRFIIMVERKDADLLTPYAETLAEQAYDSLSARYGFKPETPIRIEIYRSHDDFSVRTVGLSGLGALGVSFGKVVAMDSPAARRVGEFNWGSTLWHEIGHVFTLGATGGRVPRWLSEGLSVYEERRARPAWGEEPSPLFFATYAANQLPKVSRLNDGFMRPAFPAQVPLSYFLASMVGEMIESQRGVGAIRSMLDGYRRGLTTEQVFRDVLKVEPAAFDDQFDKWLRERFTKQFAAVKPALPMSLGGRRQPGGESIPITGPFLETLERGRDLLTEGRVDEAIAELKKAKEMFPEYAQSDGPYALLARAYEMKGDKRAATAELQAMTSINEEAFVENMAASAAMLELGDRAGALAALDRAVWINPFDRDAHTKLAELAAQMSERKMAVRERRALLALDPTDRVEALYQLALAYADAGDMVSARREVLRALEQAPNYSKAQDLLLRIRASRPPGTE